MAEEATAMPHRWPDNPPRQRLVCYRNDLEAYSHSFSAAIRIAWIRLRAPSLSVAEAR